MVYIRTEQEKNYPLVSVIVTTKNEEKNIENCLQSIINQAYKNFELIVVDNFSVDKTVEIAKMNKAEVYLKGNERSSQRNFGARKANGKYLIYLDADMILTNQLIEQCVLQCETQNIDALYIPEKIVGKGFWIKVRDFERSFYSGTVIDAVRFIRKDLFLKAGGFDESLVGPEDWDFDKKIRRLGQIGLSKASLYHNEGKFNMKLYLKKKKYYTPGLQKYVKKFGSDDQDVAKQVGMRYRLIGVFVEKGKWKKLVRHPLLTIAMYILRFRVALAYMKKQVKYNAT